MHLTPRQQTIVAGLLLCLVTLLALGGVVRNGFVGFDDLEYLFENPPVYGGLSLAGLRWALTATYGANWFPLTWLSHMADMSLFGADPAGHHLTSLLLHLLNVLLLLALLVRLTGAVWRSAAVAALFAIHPLQVESVAWVAERKSVLSMLIFLLTLHAYLGYCRRPTFLGYTAVAVLFACGLAAKPILVTLPVILLLLDAWPLGRTAVRGLRPLLLEKVPLFVLAIASSMVTLAVQAGGGAVKEGGLAAIVANVPHALVNYCRYLSLVFWPVDLAVLYPYEKELPAWQPVTATLLLGLATFLAVRSWQRRPYLVFGWCWFMVSLLPVSGLIRVGAHSIADRYVYLPLVGIGIATVWAAAELLAATRYGRAAAILLAIVSYAPLGVATARQVGYWHDSGTLFEHAVAVTRENWLAHNNLALELVKQGKPGQAYGHAREAVRINPAYADGWYNLGKIFANLGDNGKARRAYQAAIDNDPAYAAAYLKLALLDLEEDDGAAALARYRVLVRLDRSKAELLRPYLPATGPNGQR